MASAFVRLVSIRTLRRCDLPAWLWLLPMRRAYTGLNRAQPGSTGLIDHLSRASGLTTITFLALAPQHPPPTACRHGRPPLRPAGVKIKKMIWTIRPEAQSPGTYGLNGACANAWTYSQPANGCGYNGSPEICHNEFQVRRAQRRAGPAGASMRERGDEDHAR